ncbi:MAG: hypothetical protein JNL50_10660 [Phycisphaerae bacterium]|nr:hypothetical protein [Phycisphaerae bacterium]
MHVDRAGSSRGSAARRAGAAWLAVLGFCGGAASAVEPPRVVEVVPDIGDVGVDPGLREVRVRFDQDMSPGGRSICGGGPGMLPIADRPRWDDARTLVIPVSLGPSMLYSFSINCPSARNFRGAGGESAVVYQVSFRTRGADDAGPVPLKEGEGGAMVEKLRHAILDRYSHMDKLPVDFERRLDEASPGLAASATPAAFARGVRDLLRPSRDGHVWVRVNDITLGVRDEYAAVNYDERRLRGALQEVGEHEGVTTAKLAGGVGYLAFDDWSRRNGDWLAPALEFLGSLGPGAPLVVDVRANGGGDEELARSVAARFVEERMVYAKSLIREPGLESGFDGPFDRVVEPAGRRHDGPVAILIGPACVSSNESFILMMRKAGRRETFGDTTGGSSGNPKAHELGGGVTLFLPSWRDLTAEGVEIEDRGIEPDHRVVWPGVDPSRDPVLDAALAWLKERAAR